MVTRTLLSKNATIFKGSDDNFGLNPICMLHYGRTVSRFLIKFDIDELRKCVEDGTYSDVDSLKHVLKMKNCGSIDPKKFDQTLPSYEFEGEKQRATSFTLLFTEVPDEWDEGVGFDNSFDFWLLGKQAVSRDACNWFQAKNGFKWEEEGVVSTETLANEYDKFAEGQESMVIARQVFDHGNEDINVDITDYVNKLIKGEKRNNGILVSFTPRLEETKTRIPNYVGFFGSHTRTFYEPVVETRYNEDIKDDRYKFYVGKTNKLYFYAVFEGSMENLDELPVCTIDGVEYPVKRQTKGVYYAEVKLPKNAVSDDTIMYDVWSNLKYQGDEMDDVEQEFVAKKFNFTTDIDNTRLEPVISGINDAEKMYQGDVRWVNVDFMIPYESSEYSLVNNAYYRLYVLDGNREVDVIDWDKLMTLGMHNTFKIDTRTLVPQEYVIDIKAELGRETRIFKRRLKFKIMNVLK